MSFIGQQLVSKGQGCVDCCDPLMTGSSSSCVVFTSCLLAVLSSFKFSSCFSPQTAMEWGLLAGLLGFVSCWPGAVFSGWLNKVEACSGFQMERWDQCQFLKNCMPTPPPNPKLTLTFYQLTIGKGGGGCVQVLSDSPQDMFVIHVYFKLKIISIGFRPFMLFFFY